MLLWFLVCLPHWWSGLLVFISLLHRFSTFFPVFFFISPSDGKMLTVRLANQKHASVQWKKEIVFHLQRCLKQVFRINREHMTTLIKMDQRPKSNCIFLSLVFESLNSLWWVHSLTQHNMSHPQENTQNLSAKKKDQHKFKLFFCPFFFGNKNLSVVRGDCLSCLWSSNKMSLCSR